MPNLRRLAVSVVILAYPAACALVGLSMIRLDATWLLIASTP
jgi:hypothetical protein